MSTIATNTITNVAGNATGVGIAVSNAATYNSEGGAVTQNLVQGLAKTWLRMQGEPSVEIKKSLNVSSIADQGTGNFRVNINNAMSDILYNISSAGGGAVSNNTLMNVSIPADQLTANRLDLDVQYAHTTANDPRIVCMTIHGDLA